MIHGLQIELVANVWPIVDGEAMIIQRFAARAYAVDMAQEARCMEAVRCLSRTDFYTAKQYALPQRFKVATQFGDLPGCVSPNTFNQHLGDLVDDALVDLAKSCPDFVGISDSGAQPRGVSFPESPYVITTFLIEDAEGNLTVYQKDAAP